MDLSLFNALELIKSNSHDRGLRCREIARVQDSSRQYPIDVFELGNPQAAACLVIVGGVHGLERIGSQLALHWLERYLQLLTWDTCAKRISETLRIVFLPALNPFGLSHSQRSNGSGVDLMRNAPIEAHPSDVHWLVGGQRWSPRLPWYRGREGAPLEIEVQALVDLLDELTRQHRYVLALDLHSGFGLKDRLWYPFAYRRNGFPDCGVAEGLSEILDMNHPHHAYLFEPQSTTYCTHGDVWDFAYLRWVREAAQTQFFLPLCLELGSWNWIKKNPRQLFSLFGVFNPVKPHRYARAMRRHWAIFDLCLRVMSNPDVCAALAAKRGPAPIQR